MDGDKQPSLDGVRRPEQKPQPDYRPEHELPAPEPTPLIEEHEPAKTAITAPPIEPDGEGLGKKPHISLRKWLLIGLAAVVAVVVAVLLVSFIWYQQQLVPVTSDTTKRVRVTISIGETPDAIAAALRNAGVIRSKLAFTLYAKFSGAQNNLKAGTYSLQPSLSTQGIVDHLVSGKEDTFDVTFLPGDSLATNRKKLIGFGFSAADVDAALNKSYDRPLFATKPAGTDLEGYLYGDTIEFDSSATVEQILGRFFDEYESAVTDNNLAAAFQKQGLTLYQGITLASIVQREVTNPTPSAPNDDQRQVARVFLNRMRAGMTLGSDITAYYGADKIGAQHSVAVDTPYNTRIHAGLPPGPIATPGLGALLAVANPASNDYLFFLSGDDNQLYFAKTDAQHQQNITQHCQKKCAVN